MASLFGWGASAESVETTVDSNKLPDLKFVGYIPKPVSTSTEEESSEILDLHYVPIVLLNTHNWFMGEYVEANGGVEALVEAIQPHFKAQVSCFLERLLLIEYGPTSKEAKLESKDDITDATIQRALKSVVFIWKLCDGTERTPKHSTKIADTQQFYNCVLSYLNSFTGYRKVYFSNMTFFQSMILKAVRPFVSKDLAELLNVLGDYDADVKTDLKQIGAVFFTAKELESMKTTEEEEQIVDQSKTEDENSDAIDENKDIQTSQFTNSESLLSLTQKKLEESNAKLLLAEREIAQLKKELALYRKLNRTNNANVSFKI
eukprot:g257.t1